MPFEQSRASMFLPAQSKPVYTLADVMSDFPPPEFKNVAMDKREELFWKLKEKDTAELAAYETRYKTIVPSPASSVKSRRPKIMSRAERAARKATTDAKDAVEAPKTETQVPHALVQVTSSEPRSELNESGNGGNGVAKNGTGKMIENEALNEEIQTSFQPQLAHAILSSDPTPSPSRSEARAQAIVPARHERACCDSRARRGRKRTLAEEIVVAVDYMNTEFRDLEIFEDMDVDSVAGLFVGSADYKRLCLSDMDIDCPRLIPGLDFFLST